MARKNPAARIRWCSSSYSAPVAPWSSTRTKKSAMVGASGCRRGSFYSRIASSVLLTSRAAEAASTMSIPILSRILVQKPRRRSATMERLVTTALVGASFHVQTSSHERANPSPHFATTARRTSGGPGHSTRPAAAGDGSVSSQSTNFWSRSHRSIAGAPQSALGSRPSRAYLAAAEGSLPRISGSSERQTLRDRGLLERPLTCGYAVQRASKASGYAIALALTALDLAPWTLTGSLVGS